MTGFKHDIVTLIELVESMPCIWDKTIETNKNKIRDHLKICLGFQVYDLSLSKEQVIGMSTFVPNELISLLLKSRRYSTLIGVVMFADVSGFTPLCETYAKFGPNGAYRLTATLNEYIGAMVDLIYTFGGDVLKFSGDAFLAAWHCKVDDYLEHKIHDAISCALHIQYTLGNFVTDVGLHLRVKLAIATGNLVFCAIGKEKSATYVVYGLPILEVKKAESLCKSGDTVLAPSAWSFLSSQNYSSQELGGGYIKVKQILCDPKSVKRTVFEFDPGFIKKIHTKNRMLKMMSSKTDPSATILDFEKNFRKIIFADRLIKASESLRPFVISPVMQQIEANQSLDYTVEMRQVTIMFINVIPNTTSCKGIVILVDETYQSILKSIQNRLGLINKVCLFDKDIMFLVIFGLKGYKDKDEAMRTLNAGHEILQNVSEFECVKSISIGITVGTTYCGVVGHPLRKEYTVIGAPVNKAARLGCMFKNMVSCDASVAFNSRLPRTFFEKLEPKKLKGIGTVKNIYKYRDIGVSALSIPPILGRYNLIKKFADMLWEDSPYKAMVIIGEPRVGKTRVLLEFCESAENADWHTVMTSLNTKIGPHGCLVHKMVASVLGCTVSQRMKALWSLYANQEEIENLYLLNTLFDVSFPEPPNAHRDESLKAVSEILYKKTLQRMFNKHVIVVDDADFLDKVSWSVLLDLIKAPNVLVAISLPSTSDIVEPHVSLYLNHPLIMTVKLGNLPYKYIAPLVCQMLAVDAVPHKLIRALYKISKGNPGWVQAFLLSFVDTGAFEVNNESLSTLSRRSFYVPDQVSRLTKLTKSSISISMGDDGAFNEEQIHVCKIIKKDLGEDGIPPTFDDVIMATFDNLTAFEQLLLKCGAILGKEFHRSELEAVMNFPSTLTLALAVKNLFEIDIFGCATELHKSAAKTESYDSPFAFKEPIKCNCPSTQRSRFSRLPKYALCQLMTFRFEILRKTIYQIIPLNQRTEFHLRAFNYLRLKNVKCTECINYEILVNIKKKDQNIAGNMSLTPEGIIDKKRASVHFEDSESSTVSESKVSPEVRRRAVLGVARPAEAPSPLPSDQSLGPKEVRRATLLSPGSRTDRVLHQPSTTKSALFFTLVVSPKEDLQSKTLLELPLYLPHVVKCTCNQLVKAMYEKLLYHSDGADARIEKLKILVEFGIHHVRYSNFVQAYNLLKDSLELCEEMLRSLSSFDTYEEKGGIARRTGRNISVREILLEKEKALCYFGKCCTHLGNFRRASVELSHVANVSIFTDLEFQFKKMLIKMKAFPQKYRDQIRAYISLKAYAYTFLSHAHIMQFEYAEAEDAIKSAIRYANMVNHLKCSASAYATYIDINLVRGNYKRSRKAEKEAIEKCLPLFREKDIWDVMYLGKVLVAVFKGRLYRGELSQAVNIAKAALHTAFSFRAYNVQSFVYPLLLRCVTYQKKFEDITEILYNLKSCRGDYTTFEKNSIARLYNHLNLTLLIEIGFCAEFPLELVKSMQEKYTSHFEPKYRSHAILSRRVIIQMWLWHIRRKEFDLAQQWEVEPHDGLDLLYENIPYSLTLLEAQIQWMVYLIDSANEISCHKINEMFKLLDLRIRQLEWICKKRRLFLQPRILHLKAYKNIICFNYDESKRQIPGLVELKKSLKISGEHGNIHEIGWIHHSLKEWYTTSDNGTKGHSDSFFEVMSFSEDKHLFQYQQEETLYHLPLPNVINDKLKECIVVNKEVLISSGLVRTGDI